MYGKDKASYTLYVKIHLNWIIDLIIKDKTVLCLLISVSSGL